MNIPGFKVIRELSRGGMAKVYLALQENLDREVVLKVVSPNLPDDPAFKEALLNEGKVIAKLRHPNIIVIYDLGCAAGSYYILMEYVAGGDLRRRIEAGLTLRESLQIVTRIAHALDYIHQNGAVHRDIKPTNVLFKANDWPVLTDFGIARLQSAGLDLHNGEAFIGTPRYVSPERVKGEPEDARSDLYSLGAIFFEMLTGLPLYVGKDTQATALRHVTDPVPELPKALAFLRSVLGRLLAKDPAQRFRDAGEFIGTLAQVVREHLGEQVPSEPTAGQRLLDMRAPAAVMGGWERTHPGRHGTDPRVWQRWPGSMVFPGLVGMGVGMLSVIVWYTFVLPMLRPLDQTQHVLEQLLAYEGTQPTESLKGQSEVRSPYATYTFALALAQGQPEVLEGLRRLADRFDQRARRKWQEGQWDQGLLLVRQGLHFMPDHEGLLSLQSTLLRGQKEQRRQQRIRELLAQARGQIQRSQLTEPKGQSAFDTYNAVLALDSTNREASAGLRQIAHRFDQGAQAARQGGDLRDTLGLIEQGLRVQPQDPRIQALQDTVGQQQSERGEKRTRLIAQWLERARLQVQAGHLTDPPGDNAFETYRVILAVAPGEPSALSGIDRIAERYVQIAQSYKDRGKLQASLAFVEEGLQAAPRHTGLVELRAQISSHNAEAVQSWLSKAEQQLVASQLTKPPGDNAYASFKEVLRLDPSNQKAREGLRQIVQHYEMLAETRQQAGSLREALGLVDEGLKVEPEHGGLLAQRKAILVGLEAGNAITKEVRNR